MFLYLLLATAIATTVDTPTIDPDLQEIITLFTATTHENNLDNSCDNEKDSTTQVTTTTTITSDISKPEQESAPITITNAIQPSMLTYKHWTGTYSPDKFTITINGVEVAQGESCTVATTKEPVEISYNYSFMNGMRSGAKAVSYQLDENITQADITFSWKDSWKVLIAHGTPVSQKEINA